MNLKIRVSELVNALSHLADFYPRRKANASLARPEPEQDTLARELGIKFARVSKSVIGLSVNQVRVTPQRLTRLGWVQLPT